MTAELGDKISFVPVNVTKYADHIQLFKAALANHGRVDHALSIAGINESDHSWFDDALDIQAVETPASDLNVDINYKGTMYFSRVALPFLRHSTSSAEEAREKSLTLLSSQLGVVPGYGIPLYQVRGCLPVTFHSSDSVLEQQACGAWIVTVPEYIRCAQQGSSS